MYNWSVDEKQFKNIKEVINFLRAQPEIISAKLSKRTGQGNKIIETKTNPKIHPARKFSIAKYIEERSRNLKISVIEEK